MNLGAGAPMTRPYALSSPELDLAAISLVRHQSFVDDLMQTGYQPVSRADIGQGPSREGAEVVSIGYPDATAVVFEEALPDGLEQWGSGATSLPVFSFGRVAMNHPALPSFWADISLYPGNSGGPVIEDDRLIGIVSEQAIMEEEEVGVTRIPFARAIRAELVLMLLDEFEERMREWPRPPA